MTNIQKCIKIIAIQKGIKVKDIRKTLNLSQAQYIAASTHNVPKNTVALRKYIVKNLNTKYVTPKIHAILNDMTFREYAKELGISYSTMVYHNL